MKLFATLALLLAATIAQATPAVGDIASFSGTTVHAGQTYPLQITLQLTAFDQPTGAFTQVTTTQVAGQTQTRSEQVAAADMITDATVESLLTNCVANGGVSEIVAVPAGTFETCKIAGDDGTLYNVGRVPFGITMVTSPENNLSLVSYVNGL